MAEALAVFGATASIVGIIDVLGKSINSIRGLRAEWNDADFVFLNLSSQLTALKAALTKIMEWMDSGVNEAHHQLIMDLDGSIRCCQMLATKIESRMSELQQNRDGVLAKSSKIRLMFGTKTMDDIQKMLERQTTALTLLLTACNCNTILEQKRLLENSKNRKTLHRVEKDSASLIVLRDVNSLNTNFTDTLSKLSMRFDFDSDLFTSKVYERAFRMSLRMSFRFWRQDSTDPAVQSHIPSKVPSRAIKIVMLGPSLSSKSTLLKQMRITYGRGYSKHERKLLRVIVFHNLLFAFQFLLDSMEEQQLELENSANLRWTELVLSHPDILPESALPNEVLLAFKSLLQDDGIQSAILKGVGNDLIENMSYFIPNLDRIFALNYLPSDQDILHLRLRTTGISETTFNIDDLEWRVFDVAGVRSERKKWIHVFDRVDIVFFHVALNGYYQGLIEDRTGNQMAESLMLFEQIANSSLFKNSKFVLIFTKVDLLRKDLSSGLNPIRTYYPGYEGEANNVTAVQDFFGNKFKALLHRSIELYIHYIDATDSSQVKTIVESVQQQFSS